MSHNEFVKLSIPLSSEIERQVESAARMRGMTVAEFTLAALIDALAEQGYPYATHCKHQQPDKNASL